MKKNIKKVLRDLGGHGTIMCISFRISVLKGKDGKIGNKAQ